MNLHDFTIPKALEIQQGQLERWKSVLNDIAFAMLMQEVEKRNNKGYVYPADVLRGTMIDEIVFNVCMNNLSK